MARKIRDEKLATRTARLKLKPRREPYWRVLRSGLAIGYRRIEGRSGTWIAKHYDPDADRKRVYGSLGEADDFAEADSRRVLAFDDAQEAAARWLAGHIRKSNADDGEQHPETVAQAVERYLADYERRGRKALAFYRTTFNAYVLPALGPVHLNRLTTSRLEKWHHDIAATGRRLRVRKGDEPRHREMADDDRNARRARRSTANGVLAALKAVLNFAWRKGWVADPNSWRKVQPFQGVDAPRVRWLSDDEIRRLTNACPTDFRDMVTGALLTGCRYGELARLHVEDFELDAATVFIAESKSGKSRHVPLTEEGVRFFQAKAAGKVRADLLLPRSDGRAWGKSQQQRPLMAACEAAKIAPAISFHILRHTYGSRLARKGVPMKLIAELLGHSDIRITQRHYAHVAHDHMADVLRAAFGSLGIVEPTNVSALRGR